MLHCYEQTVSEHEATSVCLLKQDLQVHAKTSVRLQPVQEFVGLSR